MKTVAEILIDKSTQDMWEFGSDAQQQATLLVENFIFNSEISEQTEETVAQVLYAMNKDCQVRDYIMGLTDTVASVHVEGVLNWLISEAPKGFKAAPACVLSIVYYEADDAKNAYEVLDVAKQDTPEYALTILLSRVYNSGWNKDAFGAMRRELHPKVTAGIFGEAQYDNSN
jgi:hypothetical protein